MKEVTIDNVRERMNEIEMWRGANNLSVSLKEEFELACLRALVGKMAIESDMHTVIHLLANNEWAEHCTETVLGSMLEAEVTRLVGSVRPAPVVRDEHLLQSLETRINSLEIGERKGALSTQQATSLKAYRLAVQCLRSSATSDENATDNTAQQFEALATGAHPEIIGYESRVICGEPRRVPKFAGQDIEATSAGSGKP